jgi:hypothetical protein
MKDAQKDPREAILVCASKEVAIPRVTTPLEAKCPQNRGPFNP